jgi:hypothetical protein
MGPIISNDVEVTPHKGMYMTASVFGRRTGLLWCYKVSR